MHADTAGACSPWICAANERVAENACVACAPGMTKVAVDDASGANTVCEAVICANANEHVVDHECVACPAGTTSLAPYCDDGTGADTGDDEDACNAAHAALVANQGSAQAAHDPTGFVWRQHDASGVDTYCDATLCGADEYVSTNVCTTCPGGTENDAGDDASGADTSCDAIICGENEYVSTNACTTCPAGTTHYAGDDASGSDTACTVCDTDYHVSSGTCTQCAAGTQRTAGDDQTGADTTCDRCAEDYRVVSNACVQCAAGKTNMENDPVAGGDTECTATICARTEYVSGNACVECPPGTRNALSDHAGHIGDDASGADTTCDAIYCDENEMVESNTCVACPAGYVNPLTGDPPAGDDSSGSDTSCAWDGRFCAVHTILPASNAFCATSATTTDNTLTTRANCEAVEGNVWTRHQYELPKWADGKGAGLKAPSDCVVDGAVAGPGVSTDCDIYDNDGTSCDAYAPATAAPHCYANVAAGGDPDTGCDRFDYSEERCLGLNDCFAYDGSTDCDAYDGTTDVPDGDRETCLATAGCQWHDATGAHTTEAGNTCMWGGASSCTFVPAEDYADGTDKVCQSCPAGSSSSGRSCSCSLACTF